MSDSTPPIEQRTLRDVLGTFVTGVTVVTTRDADGQAHGVTANSFSSVSLDPPLVLWSQALTSRSYPAFSGSQHFSVNILADDQIAISNHFAKSRDDKFADIAHRNGLGGAPVLDGVAAHLECVKVASYPSGDHVVYIGRVELVSHSGRAPLAFGSGKYMVAYTHDLGPASLRKGTSRPADHKAISRVTQAMPGIARSLGEHSLCLAVWGNHGPTSIHWEPSAQPVSDQLHSGLVMSITRSAIGRVFAAFMPEAMTRAMIEEELRLSPDSDQPLVIRRTHFDEEIEEVRARGIARAIGTKPSDFHNVPVNAFSVPIRDSDGHMVMALSLPSSASRLGADWEGAVPLALKAAAEALSAELGYVPEGRAANAAGADTGAGAVTGTGAGGERR